MQDHMYTTAHAAASPSDTRLATKLDRWITRIHAGVAGMPVRGDAQARDSAPGQSLNPRMLSELGDNLQRMLDWLQNSAGLNDVEAAILEFSVAAHTFAHLRRALTVCGDVDLAQLPHALGAILDLDMRAIAQAVAPAGRLMAYGLLRPTPSYDDTLDQLLRVPRKLADRIPFHTGEPADLISNLSAVMPEPALSLRDYPHMELDNRLARSWLGGALLSSRQRQPAGHLLVTGAPGLGKTQWVRALLKESKVQARELEVVHDNGAPLSGQDRLSHLRLVLNLLNHSERTAVVFDEADDVFSSPAEAADGAKEAEAGSGMRNQRASLNRLLETSRIPVIWIMNQSDVLDPAVLRRFDAVIRFSTAPHSVRLGLLQKACPAWMPDEQQRWAQVHSLSPALIAKLAQLDERSLAAGQALDQDLRRHWLQGRIRGRDTRHLQPGINRRTGGELPAQAGSWSPDLVNADCDLQLLAEGIGRSGSARILLHGEPGTGKTAYACQLAQRLGLPLIQRRASDLLSPWVGATEQLINQAFEEVQGEGMLFIDEADSLLAAREHAARTWEISQVNELLQQLGEFDGVVVLATNRLDALDSAVLRRMDRKVRFGPLSTDQVVHGFAQLARALGLRVADTGSDSDSEPVEEQIGARLRQLRQLTPGDLALLARRHAFEPFENIHALLEALEAEVRLKNRGRQPVGFIAPASPSRTTKEGVA